MHAGTVGSGFRVTGKEWPGGDEIETFGGNNHGRGNSGLRKRETIIFNTHSWNNLDI